jgi:hypothetical protein
MMPAAYNPLLLAMVVLFVAPLSPARAASPLLLPHSERTHRLHVPLQEIRRHGHQFRLDLERKHVVEQLPGGSTVEYQPFSQSEQVATLGIAANGKSIFAIPLSPGGRVRRFDIATKSWSDWYLPPVGTTPFTSIHETSDGRYLVTTQPKERDGIEVFAWEIGASHDARPINSYTVHAGKALHAPDIRALDDKPTIIVRKYDEVGQPLGEDQIIDLLAKPGSTAH